MYFNKAFAPRNKIEERQFEKKVNTTHVQSMRDLYDVIYESFPPNFGKALSKKERSAKKLYDTSLIYGEIEYETLGTALQKIIDVYGKPNVGASGDEGILQHRGGIFYDLGSGVGKAVITAALIYPFDICCGIEVLEELHKGAQDVRAIYEKNVKMELDRAFDTVVDFRHGDIFNSGLKKWTDGTVIFINSTCFDDEMMVKLAHLAARLSLGAFVITLTKRLPSRDFEICEYQMNEMSWGSATIYIQQKITDSHEYDSDDYDSENDL